MSSPDQFHIVDCDSRRRAQIAFDLRNRGYPTHVYEDIRELTLLTPSDGVILLSGDDDPKALAHLRQSLAAVGRYIPIAMYSSRPVAEKAVNAVLAGAVDYFEWPIPGDPRTVLDRIASRAKGSQRGEKRRMAAAKLVSGLSKREQEVLALLVSGLSNKAIAQNLQISPRTVEIHRANAIRKLNVDSTAGAVRIGIYAGLDE